MFFFFFSSRRRHTRSDRDWSSDVCSSDLKGLERSGTEAGGRIDDRLAALQGLYQVFFPFLLDSLGQELVDLSIGRHDFAQVERAREQQQQRAEDRSIEQGQAPSKRSKERKA